MEKIVVAYSVRSNLTRPLEVGQTHFSLSLAADRYITAFKKLGLSPLKVERPEIFGTDVSRKFIAPNLERIVHVSFGDFQTLRILKGAYNIACVAWEYERISDSFSENKSPWTNQKWVLNLFDEVWVGSEFTKRALVLSGIKNVYVVPPPVPGPLGVVDFKIDDVIGESRCNSLLLDFTKSDPQYFNERWLAAATTTFSELYLRKAQNKDLRIYLTIVNFGDARKNVEATLLAFALFSAAHPNVLLVVKSVGSSDVPLFEKIWRQLTLRIKRLSQSSILKSDAILFVDGFLSEEKLMQLIASSDFYISTSFAEGFNSPVVEAMMQGAIVISPIHTAMTDYLTVDNCISCDFTVQKQQEPIGDYSVDGAKRYEVEIKHAVKALELSASMGANELELRRSAALRRVRHIYDFDGVSQIISSRLKDIESNAVAVY